MMDACLKLSIGAVAAALAALTIRRQNEDLALLLGVAGCCMGGLLTLELLSPVLEQVRRLFSRTGLDEALLSPLLKCVGVALLSQLASAICLDAGQSALAKTVELGGAVLALTLSLPLISAVLSLLEQLSSG